MLSPTLSSWDMVFKICYDDKAFLTIFYENKAIELTEFCHCIPPFPYQLSIQVTTNVKHQIASFILSKNYSLESRIENWFKTRKTTSMTNGMFAFFWEKTETSLIKHTGKHSKKSAYTGVSKSALQLWKLIEIYTLFCYILTVQNVVYVLSINFYKVSKL
jgi:hypothetical protein